jgi:hypothetical protein
MSAVFYVGDCLSTSVELDFLLSEVLSVDSSENQLSSLIPASVVALGILDVSGQHINASYPQQSPQFSSHDGEGPSHT